MQGKFIEFVLDFALPEDTYMRVSLKNSIGHSELSNSVKIVKRFTSSNNMSINNIMLIMVAITVPLALLLTGFLALK